MEGDKDDARRSRPLNIAFSGHSSLGLSLSDLPTGFPDESLCAKITLQLRGTGKPSEARRLAPHYHREVSALLTGVWSSQLDQKTFLAFSLLFLVSGSFQPCTEPVPKPLPFPFTLLPAQASAPSSALQQPSNWRPAASLCTTSIHTPCQRFIQTAPRSARKHSRWTQRIIFGGLLSQLLLISGSPGVQFALL